MNDDPRDRVRRLAAVVQARQALPDDLARWLGDGLQHWLASGGRGSLDTFLGLRGAGVRTVETHDRVRRRDAALAHALEFAHDGQPRAASWRAKRLADAIERFEARTWPRVRDCDRPPERLSRLERNLFEARAANGQPLPQTPQYLETRAYGKTK